MEKKEIQAEINLLHDRKNEIESSGKYAMYDDENQKDIAEIKRRLDELEAMLNVIAERNKGGFRSRFSKGVREVAAKIGQFYLEKNDNNYDKTRKEIVDLHITKLDVIGNTVHITAAMVGKLIGKRGQNIDALNKYLGMPIKIIEEGETLLDYLVPHEPIEDAFPPNFCWKCMGEKTVMEPVCGLCTEGIEHSHCDDTYYNRVPCDACS